MGANDEALNDSQLKDSLLKSSIIDPKNKSNFDFEEEKIGKGT